MGAGRRLHMITSADAMPGKLRLPVGVYRYRPGRFYTDETNCIGQFVIMPPKKQVVKKEARLKTSSGPNR